MLKTSYILILAAVLYIISGFVYDIMDNYTYTAVWRLNPNIDTMVFWLLQSISTFCFFFASYQYILEAKDIKHHVIISKILLLYGYAELGAELFNQFFMYGESSNDWFILLIGVSTAIYCIWKQKKQTLPN